MGLHHESLIDVPLDSVTLTSLLNNVKQLHNNNTKELVLIFHSELMYLKVDNDAA